jgi:hypothetical protein|tara:strand:- start:1213 stop:2106 length:894 start_codon:yes stop_codon:yes gene_type:complete
MRSLNYNLLARNALPIKDKEVLEFIKNTDSNNFFSKSLENTKILEQFNTYYFQWIQKSKLNKLRGIKKFKHVAFVHGTSQSFDFFYAENKSKRFRCFKGDFFYHVISWKRNNSKFAYLDDGKIKKNDAVVISIPFSDNGYIHNMTNDILEQCDKLGVPVLIDLAYYNLVRELNFNINRPCISTITFSLSKGYYPLDKLRIGIRCKKEFTDDPIDVFNSYDMFNKAGAALGLKIMKKFSPDYNQEKYGEKQIEICDKFGLEPSKSVIFGLGDKKYSEYNRGSYTNRVCISKLLVKSYL